MGFLDRIRNRAEEEVTSQVDEPLLRALLKRDKLDRTRAMSLPAVSSAVDMICNTFAMIPFKLYEEYEKDGKMLTKEVKDGRVSLINDDTKDKLDGFQFKKALCEDFLLGKGGYAYIKRRRNEVIGLYYVQDNEVTVMKNADAIFKNYYLQVGAKRYNDYDFIKLLRNTKDGAVGTGVVDEINTVLQAAYKRILYDLNLATTGGSRKGFLKTSHKLDQASIDALKRAWEDYYGGNANTVILNDGMEFQEASNTSQENEINAKQTSFGNEIDKLFHIGKSYEETIKNCVMPIAEAFATALNRDLLLENEKGSFYFAPDTKELYKGSLKERYDAYAVAIQNGFKTRNEIRYLENDDAIQGLDVINLGLGSVLLDTKTGEIYTPNTNSTVKLGDTTAEGGE